MRTIRVLGPLLRGWPGLLAAGLALSGLSIAELGHCDCRLVAQPVDPVLVAALQALSILPLALSRRWPVAALVGGGLVLLGMSLAGMHQSAFQFVAVLAMLALACLQLDQLRSAPLALAVAGGTVLVRRDAAPEEVAFEVAVVALTWALAAALGTHRRLVLALREQTRSLELAQVEAARRAGAEERARLGRELHDVVAHSLGVIVLQAAGGRRALERAPEQARQALEAIERTGRDALTEMRQALELLRPDGEDARTTPPGVAAVPELVERCRRSGLQVELERALPAVLPAMVDASIYRIAQEALTNCLKHAPGARVHIQLHEDASGVVIVVSDDGGQAVAAATPTGGGRGLTGMRERAASLGGRLEAGPGPDGGWLVQARLPLPETG